MTVQLSEPTTRDLIRGVDCVNARGRLGGGRSSCWMHHNTKAKRQSGIKGTVTSKLTTIL